MNKKNILFIAYGNEKWIGGLYYVRNIIYVLLQNKNAIEQFNISIYVDNKYKNLFNSFLKFANVRIITFSGEIEYISIIDICEELNINTIYPVFNCYNLTLENISINWIPDFQHIHLKDMFSEDEIRERNEIYKSIAMNHKGLILSSKSAYNDYKNMFPEYLENVYIVPFVSYIEDEVKKIDDNFIEKVISKYFLPNKYIYLPNQFWKHKNHITAFKAINILKRKYKINIKLVCTGYTEDYRNVQHFRMLLSFIEEHDLKNNIVILGFIGRDEQLAIMKKANLIIQPSLFEGWGTCVEDAKALNKRIILSDIPVHYEQKDENCTLYSKEDYLELAKIIKEELTYEFKENSHYGLDRTKERAKSYSHAFYDILNSYNLTCDIKEQKDKLMSLFKNSKSKNIGIYGTGEHTEVLIKVYKKIFGEINFNLYFFDSNQQKCNKTLLGYKVYLPKYIDSLNLDRIIISSHAYQNQIYEQLKAYEDKGIKIYKIYNENQAVLFKKYF